MSTDWTTIADRVYNVDMTQTRIPLWVAEHGAEYRVPDAITKLEGIDDLSWHNDACPSFGKAVEDPVTHDNHVVHIWVDFVDQDPTLPHYYVVDYTPWSAEPVPGLPAADMGLSAYEGTDVKEAIAVFMEVLAVVHLEMARRRG